MLFGSTSHKLFKGIVPSLYKTIKTTFNQQLNNVINTPRQFHVLSSYTATRLSQSIIGINSNVAAFFQPSPIIESNKMLLQSSIILPSVLQSCGFKVKGRLKRRCKDCYYVLRDRRAYIICKTHPRHKQMAMKKSPQNTWILTHATQSKVRPY